MNHQTETKITELISFIIKNASDESELRGFIEEWIIDVVAIESEWVLETLASDDW